MVTSIQLFTPIDFLKALGIDRVSHIDGTQGTIRRRSERPDRLIVEFDTGVTTEQPLNLLRSPKLDFMFLPHRSLELNLRDHDSFSNTDIANPEVLEVLHTLVRQIHPFAARASIESLLTGDARDSAQASASKYAGLHRLFDSINNDPLECAIDSFASQPEFAVLDFINLVFKIRLLETVLTESCNEFKPVRPFFEVVQRVAKLTLLSDVHSTIETTIRSRLEFDLRSKNLTAAKEGYKNNVGLLGQSWFSSTYRIAKEKLEQDISGQVRQAIVNRQSAYMQGLVREARAQQLTIDYDALEMAEIEISQIHRFVASRDFHSLSSLTGCTKTDLATTYLRNKLKSLVATASSRSQGLVEQGMFQQARRAFEEIQEILPNWKEETERLDRLEAEATEKEERRREEVAERQAEEAKRMKAEAKRMKRVQALEAKWLKAKQAVNEFADRFVRLDFRPVFKSRALTEESAKLILTWRFDTLEEVGSCKNEVIKLCERGDFETARLWSARAAEIGAIEYWRCAGLRAHDVSLKQLFNDTEEWKRYDLRVGDRYVDVKNARASFSSNKNFSELCVPRFKQHRAAGQEVHIMGVFSEYVTAAKMAEEGAVFEMQVLGTVSASEISSLEESVRLLSGGFLDMKIFNRNGQPEKFLPGWLFDHGEWLNPERATLLGKLPVIIGNWVKAGGSIGYVPLPMRFLASMASQDVDFDNHRIEPKAFDIMRELVRREGLTLRSVVVGIILACVRCVWLVNSSFQPTDLWGFMFFESDGSKQHPLGLYDPLGYCSSIIDVFQILYEKNRDGLKHYRSFRIQGAGIFQGRIGEGKWQTLIAYCGGKNLRNKVACGRNPIFLGESVHCEECGKLICPDCRFCSKICPRCLPRQQELVDALDRPERGYGNVEAEERRG